MQYTVGSLMTDLGNTENFSKKLRWIDSGRLVFLTN